VATLQPHTPATHAVPLALPAQLMQAAPLVPQVVPPLPLTQVPALQQPPLHGWLASQVVVHALVTLHASPIGQSPTTLQPQLPAMHCAPSAPPQVWHIAPELPHALTMLPATQLVPLQQPPLQVWPLAQLVEHRCVVVLHALPLGQSPGSVQPHAPPMQLCPFALEVQSRQLPLAPHALGVLPGWQVPPEPQQPPAHGCVGPQKVVHLCAPTSHEPPGGQSPPELQPQLPAMHTLPRLDFEQSWQVLPSAPQVVSELPKVQVPLAQQPPLHNTVGVQVALHLWVDGSHASPIGQSPTTLQPQVALLMHACPFESMLQLMQLGPQHVGAIEKSGGIAASAERSGPLLIDRSPIGCEASACGSEPFCQHV
jgi:hypothetical protein